MRKIENDNSYHRSVISALKKKLAAEQQPWRELILEAHDTEIALSISDFDQEHMTKRQDISSTLLVLWCSKLDKEPQSLGRRPVYRPAMKTTIV